MPSASRYCCASQSGGPHPHAAVDTYTCTGGWAFTPGGLLHSQAVKSMLYRDSALDGLCLDEERQTEVGLDKGKMSISCVGAELEVHTHFPSMMLKSASEMGNAPHPTTRSVGVAAPRRTNSSKRRTIPGRTLGRDGRTVKMLWLNCVCKIMTRILLEI